MSAPVTRRGLLNAIPVILAADFTGIGALGGAIAEHAKDAAHPDAELLRLCADYRRLEAEYRRLSVATDMPDTSPGFAELWALYEENIALNREALDAIAETPARTQEGVKAKACALMAFYAFDDGRPGSTYPQDYPVHRAIWSLIEDAAGRTAP